MKCLNDFHLQNQRFMSISMADGFRCISLAKSRMRESRMSGSVRGCSLRGQSTRPGMAEMGYDFATQRNATQRNGITAPFFRIKIHIFVMDDRRTRWEDWLHKQAKEPLSGSTVFCVQA